MSSEGGIGAAIRAARIAQGLSLYALAHELNLSVGLLEAVEQEAWARVPAGRERPYVRQIAQRLDIDPEAFPEQWNLLPGGQEQEPPDPRQERLERVLMGALTVGTAALLLWLVVPGRSLRQERPRPRAGELRAARPPWGPAESPGAFPVLGEVLPEAPVNAEGALISMRAQDTCEAEVAPEGGGPAQRRSLRISEPWQLRSRGPFTITLDNAGVVVLEVAGRRIRHGRTVGEPWSGRFGENGDWIIPPAPVQDKPPTAPETDPPED